MNSSVTLDYLISKEEGNTFIFDCRFCPLSLLKEVILRDYQVRNVRPKLEYGYGCGMDLYNIPNDPFGSGEGTGIFDPVYLYRSFLYRERGNGVGEGESLGAGSSERSRDWLTNSFQQTGDGICFDFWTEGGFLANFFIRYEL